MHVVIDIPEEIYSHTQEYEVGGFNQENDTKLFMAIKNGTPLPKGHGKLIDADAIIAEATERMKYPANYKYMECVIAHMKLAPTVVEADKESEVQK